MKNVTQLFTPRLMKLLALLMLAALIGKFAHSQTCNASYTYYTDSITGDIQFNNLSSALSGTPNYYWSFGDGTNSITKNPLHHYSSIGTYTVCLLMISDSNCFDSVCKSVTVSGASSANCHADFNTFVDTTTFPTNVYFTNLSSGNNLSYFWDFGDGYSSTDKNPTHQYNRTAFFNVCLKVIGDSGNCIDKKCKMFAVWGVEDSNTNIGCDASFTTSSDSINVVKKLIFTPTTPFNSNIIYKWSFGDGSTSTAYSPSHVFSTSDDNYVVCLSITNLMDSCNATHCDSIFPSRKTGIKEEGKNLQIGSIYPNPVVDNVTIELQSNSAEIVEIVITDAMGKLQTSEKMYVQSGKNVQQINTSTLAKGVYFMEIKGAHYTEIRRLLK